MRHHSAAGRLLVLPPDVAASGYTDSPLEAQLIASVSQLQTHWSSGLLMSSEKNSKKRKKIEKNSKGWGKQEKSGFPRKKMRQVTEKEQNSHKELKAGSCKEI